MEMILSTFQHLMMDSLPKAETSFLDQQDRRFCRGVHLEVFHGPDKVLEFLERR